MDFITTKDYYNASQYSSVMPTWDNLINVSSSLQTAWNQYKAKYLGDYNGQAVIDEYNDAIKEIK